jgi:hypothetical protein
MATQRTVRLEVPVRTRTSSPSVSVALFTMGRDSARPVDSRLDALAAVPGGLKEVEAALFDLLRQNLDSARPTSERNAAAKVLARARLSERQLETLAGTLKTVGPMELNTLLDAFENATSEAIGTAFVASLKDSKALSSLRVDFLCARLA